MFPYLHDLYTTCMCSENEATLLLLHTCLCVYILVCSMQLSEATLYAAGLELMEACIKRLTSMGAFEDEVRITCTCIVHGSTQICNTILLCMLTATVYPCTHI